VLQAKEHAPTPYPSVVFTLYSHLNLSRNLGMPRLEDENNLELTWDLTSMKRLRWALVVIG